MGISFWHILVVVIAFLVLFGAGKIPQMMRDLGSGVTAFKKGLREEDKLEDKTAEKSKS